MVVCLCSSKSDIIRFFVLFLTLCVCLIPEDEVKSQEYGLMGLCDTKVLQNIYIISI